MLENKLIVMYAFYQGAIRTEVIKDGDVVDVDIRYTCSRWGIVISAFMCVYASEYAGSTDVDVAVLYASGKNVSAISTISALIRQVCRVNVVSVKDVVAA